MKSTRFVRGLGPLALAGVVAGLSACGAAVPSKELVAARSAYDAAAQGKANKLVPDKVLTAKQALDSAEAAFKDDPGSFKERSLAYVAERKAEIASALAEQAEANATMARADVSYKAEQDKLRLAAKKRAEQTQKELEENQRHLKAVRAKLAQQGNQLTKASKALKQQEAELAQRKKELETEQAALKKERAAREAAEKKYALAMKSLQEIAKVQEEKRGMVITLSGSLLFTTGKADLLPIAQEKLDKVAEVLQEQAPSKKIVVYGYTDSIGTKPNNQKLSQARADTVRGYLVQKGVDASRISAIGRGEEDPVASNKTPEGRADNRRVEIVVN